MVVSPCGGDWTSWHIIYWNSLKTSLPIFSKHIDHHWCTLFFLKYQSNICAPTISHQLPPRIENNPIQFMFLLFKNSPTYCANFSGIRGQSYSLLAYCILFLIAYGNVNNTILPFILPNNILFCTMFIVAFLLMQFLPDL